MARSSRSFDWGFPRWRTYGGEQGTARVRNCDREGCGAVGDRPAPKSPNSPERWWFCETHAAEYNKNWNYFEGLSAEDARARENAAKGERSYRRSSHWEWGEGDGSRSRAERDALKALELDSDASDADVKSAHRRLAMRYHPDRAGGDAGKFQAVQAAYDVLRKAAERRAK